MNYIPKSWVSIALSLCLVLTPILPFTIQDVSAAPPDSLTGSGDEEDPYLIPDCEVWNYLSNNEATYFGDEVYFELTESIDCSADTNNVIWGDTVAFEGVLLAYGHSITIDIDRNADDTALFAEVNNGAINGLEILGTVDVVGDYSNIGGVVGLATDDTYLVQVVSQVDVTADGSDYVGGMVGYAVGDTNIEYSYVDAAIDGGNYVGGFIGYTYGVDDGNSIESSYVIGSVNGNDYVGGATGQLDGWLYLDYNFIAAVVAATGDYVGAGIGNANSENLNANHNFYDIDAVGLGSDSCITFLDEGIISTDGVDQCEGVNGVGAEPDYFYDEANEPFTVDENEQWNDGNEYPSYEYWYFPGDAYPVPFFHVNLGDFSGAGSGTDEDPYVITTCAEFMEINNSVETLGASYLLDPAADATELDCTGDTNDIMVRTRTGAFTGTFDGDDNTIIVAIDNAGDFEDHTGLFARTDRATISNLIVDGSVDGYYETGGLIGEAYYTTVSGSGSSADVNGADYYAGGLIGYCDYCTVSESYATGDVGGSEDYVGGLIGYIYLATIDESYATGDVIGLNDSVGGLVGYTEGDWPDVSELNQVYATGNVDGDTYVGGLIGYNEATNITDAYALGDVAGIDRVGGLAGQNEISTIINSYSIGLVTGDTNVGGFLGQLGEAFSGLSFWDTETSGQAESDGDELGKTTAEMKTLATYTDDLEGDAWNFETIWTMDDSSIDPANDGYPYFGWQDLELGSDPEEEEEEEEEAPRSSGGSSGSKSSAAQESSAKTETDSGPTSSTNFSFSDTPNHWAETYADKLKEKCDVFGYQNEVGDYLKTFGPDNPITRAELVRMLIACKHVEGLSFEQHFPDVNESDWFGIYITYAYEQGWIIGYQDGEFKPNQPITRAEAIKIILLSHYSAEDIIGEDATFSDVDISAWYAEFVAFAEELGFVSGYTDENGEKTGQFRPELNITRGESAKIISLVLGL